MNADLAFPPWLPQTQVLQRSIIHLFSCSSLSESCRLEDQCQTGRKQDCNQALAQLQSTSQVINVIRQARNACLAPVQLDHVVQWAS